MTQRRKAAPKGARQDATAIPEAKLVAVEALHPAPWNPRTISDERFQNLCRSIEADPAFMWMRPVLANVDGEIIGGNMRYRAAKQLGWLHVPAIVVEMSDETARERAMRDNGSWGEWDDDELAALLKDLESRGRDLSSLGFQENKLNALLDELARKPDSLAAPLYTQEQIIDAAFTYYRSIGFPYRRMELHEAMQELNRLIATEPARLQNSILGYHVADTYHPHRFHATAEGMKSPFDAYQKDGDLRKAIKLTLEYGARVGDELLSTMMITNGTQACANFRPGFAALLYRKYCPPGATVFDSSTGYGGRLVGFFGSGIISNGRGMYIGVDPNVPTHEGNVRMSADLGFAQHVELHNLPAEDVPHDVVRNRCDFAFTSPPYFAKEHYSDDETQSWVRYKTADDWRKGFLAPMFALQFAALKSGSTNIVNIADVKLRGGDVPLVSFALEEAAAAGFEYVSRQEFPINGRVGSESGGRWFEPVLVFKKP